MINNKSKQSIPVTGRLFRVVAILSSLIWANSALAETAYVTDILQLELYETQEMSGRPLKKLRSGDSMEVVQRDGRYARVRLEDGETGWVKSLYLVDKEPARTKLNKLDKELGAAKETIADLEKQLSGRTAEFEQLQNNQQGSVDQGELIQDQLKNLRIVNSDLQSRLSAYAGSVPLTWLLFAVLVALISGVVVCWYFIDSRSRARHGGYRVY